MLQDEILASILSLEKCAKLISSHQRCSVRKSVFRSFIKFTRKHMCHSLFFNKVTGLMPATLLKNRLWHRCFQVNFVKFLRKLFFTEHPWTTSSVKFSFFSAVIYLFKINNEKTRAM